jgi:putative spermidine/putrescine transport system permease protein
MTVQAPEFEARLPGAQEKITYEAGLQDEIPRLFWLVAILVLIFLLIPAAVVVLASLSAGTYLSFPPKGISLRWIIFFFEAADFLPAYLLSLRLAFLAGLTSTVVGTLAALALVRTNFPGKSFLQALFLSPLTLPGMVIGLALLIYFYSLQALNLNLVRTFTGLYLAHVMVTMPYVIRTVSAALSNFDLSQEEAARNLGAGPIQAFMRITLPQIGSGIMAGSIFAFIVSFGAFDVSLFLATPGTTPLPITMFTYLRWKFDPTPSAAGTFAILLVIVSMVVSSRLVNLGKVVGFD